MAGNPKPVSVYGVTFNKLGDRRGMTGRDGYTSSGAGRQDIFDVEDLAAALIRFDSGLVLSLEASFSLNIKEDEGTIELFGTKAGAKLSPELEIFTDQNGHLINKSFFGSTALAFENLFQNEIDHYVACVRDGCPAAPPRRTASKSCGFSTRCTNRRAPGTRSFSADERRVYKMKIGVSSYASNV